MKAIFDSHAHYDDEAFDSDRESLLSSMEEKGVGRIVNVGASLSTTKQTLELTQKYPFVYGAAGVHPDETGSTMGSLKVNQYRISLPNSLKAVLAYTA